MVVEARGWGTGSGTGSGSGRRHRVAAVGIEPSFWDSVFSLERRGGEGRGGEGERKFLGGGGGGGECESRPMRDEEEMSWKAAIGHAQRS